MKLHSSKTLIQAQKRLQSNLALDHSREALDALSKELKFKLNTNVKEGYRGAVVSTTPVRAKDMGVFADAMAKVDLVVTIVEAGDLPGTLILGSELRYEHVGGGRNGASTGVYAYDLATRKLKYLRHPI